MIRSLPYVTLALLAMACASNDSTAAEGEDVGQTESNSEALSTVHVGTDSSGQPVLASVLATGSAAADGSLAAFFQPAGCVTETTDASTQSSTYVYSDCTGPYGLLHLTGTVVVTASSSGAGQLTLQFSASNFQINEATLTSWSATAAIQADGAARDMTWNATLSGTTARGREFTRTSTKDISWTAGSATPCISIDGTADGTISGAHLQTTIKTYQRCQGACPQAGSEIDIANLDDGASVDIKYSGGDSADVSETRKGHSRSVDVALACGAL